MRNKLKLLLFSLLILSVGLVGCAQIFLYAMARSQGFQSIAEEKVSEFLKAKVEIGKINAGFVNRIALNHLEINQEAPNENPFHFQIDQIVFRYDFLKMFTRNLRAPAAILLKAPQLVLQDVNFPYDILEDLDFGSRKESISSLELQGGRVRYLLPRLKSEIDLSEIQGVLQPFGIGKIRVDIEAQAQGFISGKVQIAGEIDPIKRAHELKISLDSVQFSDRVNIPLESIVGNIRWVDGDLFFDEVAAKIHGWDTQIKGSLKNLEVGMEPALILDFELGKRHSIAQLSLKADLATHEMQGALRLFSNRMWSFSGDIDRVDDRFDFENIHLSSDYLGRGFLDFASGDYELKFKKDRQRVGVRSNLNKLDFKMDLDLDHIKVYGLDLVTKARIQIKEDRQRIKSRAADFQGNFQTDYFILEQAPFDDFKGTFQLGPTGVRDLQSTWGKVFNLKGDIPFRPAGPEGQLVLEVDNYNLESVKEFVSKPLRKSLGGLVEGKIKLEGALKKPEIIGNLSVKKGWVGKFDYDRCFIHFRGFLPYLALNDSRVLKGRTTLHLKGALDFDLDKFWHGVSLQTADKIVLWNGWEMNTSQEDGDLEINTLLSRFPTLALKAGLESGDTESAQEDQYVALGPKIKF